MIVRLLGTGAADGIPGLYSDSRVSRHARSVGGREIRSRASAIVDDGLKIDLPPDTFWQLTRDGLDARDWTALIFTHSHEDHFAVGELQYGMYPFNEREFLGYVIYGNAAIGDGVSSHYPDWPIEFVLTRSFEPFCHLAYEITPIEANHKNDEDSQNLVFSSGGRTAIYATDTGIWPEVTWEYLSGIRADALVIECTDGIVEGGYEGHLSLSRLKMVVERLRRQGTLGSGSRVVTTHHSHQGDATHEELVALLRPDGIEVGYDGLVVEV